MVSHSITLSKPIRYCIAKNFHWTKIPPNPANVYLCIAEIFNEISFHPHGSYCSDHYTFCVTINTGQKNCRIKVLLIEAGGKNGLLVKISSYTVYMYTAFISDAWNIAEHDMTVQPQ